MKLGKRLLSFMVLVVFLVTTLMVPVSAAEFTDMDGTEAFSTAVDSLNSLGVIKGYEDGTFRPMDNVTRAEFTAMLLRLLKLGDIGDTSFENPPYPDVTTPDVSWAIGNIRTAKNMKIVNGYEDGTFRPMDNVKYEEAVKMIVCALGYEFHSPEGVEWYSKYMTSAYKLGFLKNAVGAVGTPATRSCIAQMLYDCQDVEIAKDNEGTGQTVMDEANLTKKIGIIASNDVTTLADPDVNLRDNEILIKDVETGTTAKYVSNNVSRYFDKLGQRVEFLYEYDRESGKNVLSSVSTLSNNPVVIDAKYIEPGRCDATQIVYYKDGGNSRTTAKIEAESVVIYNDKLYGSNGANSTYADYYGNETLPLIGSFKLIDNNNNGIFDIVFVEEYEVFVVNGVDSSSYTIMDTLTKVQNAQRTHMKTLNPDDGTVIIKGTSGNELTFSSIQKNVSTVSVKESNSSNGGEKLITAIVNNSPVDGVVKGVSSGESVKVGSTTYEYSQYAPWINPNAEVVVAEPVNGDRGKFYLDLNGDVVMFVKGVETTNLQYGFIIKSIIESHRFEDYVYLKILQQSGTVADFKYDEKSKINGDKFDNADDFLDKLEETALLQGANTSTTGKDAASQLVKFTYSTDSNGEKIIDEIIVTELGDITGPVSEVVSDTLTMSSSFVPSANAAHRASYSEEEKLISYTDSSSVKVSNSIIFSIPANRATVSEYKKIGLYGNFKKTNTYNVEIFDVSTSGTAKVVVVYDLGVEPGLVKYSTTPFVVTFKEYLENEDNNDEWMWKVYGYQGQSATETHVWGSPDSVNLIKDLKPGDVVRFGTDTKGFATLAAEDILYGLDISRDDVISENESGNTNGIENEATGSTGYYLVDDSDTPHLRFIWGYAHAYDGTTVSILDSELAPGLTEVELEQYKHIYSMSDFSSAVVLKYDKTGRELNIVRGNSSSLDVAFSGLATYRMSDEPSELFIWSYGSNVKLVIYVVESL